MSELDEEYLNDKKHLYERVYKWTLITMVLAIMIGVIVGVRQVFVVGDRIEQSTQETQKSLRCIGEYFTQTNRATLTIKNISECTLVRE